MDGYPEVVPSKREEETAWMEDASCAGLEPDLWFPVGNGVVAKEVKKICDACPVKMECLDAALKEERGQPKFNVHGIRGGLGPTTRITLRKQVYGD